MLDKTSPPGEPRALIQPIRESWASGSGVPALFFNVTSSTTGNRVVAGPFFSETPELSLVDGAFSERYWFFSETGISSLSVIQAAVLSARFPLVTPPGVLRWTSNGKSYQRRFVDGGYFENSGVATALQIIRSLRAAAVEIEAATDQIRGEPKRLSDRVTVKLIALTHPPEAIRDPTGFSEAFSPLLAMMQARASRGRQYLVEARRELGPNNVLEFRVSAAGLKPTLGWSLMPSSLEAIKRHTSLEWRAHAHFFAANPGFCQAYS
jgi:hypothetical protein